MNQSLLMFARNEKYQPTFGVTVEITIIVQYFCSSYYRCQISRHYSLMLFLYFHCISYLPTQQGVVGATLFLTLIVLVLSSACHKILKEALGAPVVK